MRVLTLRGVIRNVANAWRHQYVGWADEPWQRKLRELEALDLDLTTPEQVVAITGNNSWVDMRCGICDVPTDVVIVLRQHSSRVDVCAACIKKADRMLEQEPPCQS